MLALKILLKHSLNLNWLNNTIYERVRWKSWSLHKVKLLSQTILQKLNLIELCDEYLSLLYDNITYVCMSIHVISVSRILWFVYHECN